MRLTLIFILAAFCAPARAQDDIPAPPNIFTGKSLRDALQETRQSKKFLIVYPHFDKPGWREMDETTWKNPTLATWVMWHAVAIRLDPKETPADYAVLKSAIARGRGKTPPIEAFPHILVFRDGKFARAYPDPDFQSFLYEANALFNDKPDATVFYPKALQLLFTLDFLCDKTRGIDPIWMALHDEANPVPAAPPMPPPLCQSDDGSAAPIADPAPGPDAVFTMVERARNLVKTKELYDATGVYSWLWERGDSFDPSFRAARLSFIASEIGELARQRDGARLRFLAIRERLAARQPWWQWGDLLEWMILSRVLGREGEVVEYLSQYTVDEQEQSMMPPSHRSVYNALSNLDDVNDPRDTSKAASDRVNARALRLAGTQRPAGAPVAEWAEVSDLRRRLLIDEGSRLYASLLLRGDLARAKEVSRLVLGASDSAQSRKSPVMTARIAGAPPQPEHQRWLSEAAGAGPTASPRLETSPAAGR